MRRWWSASCKGARRAAEYQDWKNREKSKKSCNMNEGKEHDSQIKIRWVWGECVMPSSSSKRSLQNMNTARSRACGGCHLLEYMTIHKLFSRRDDLTNNEIHVLVLW